MRYTAVSDDDGHQYLIQADEEERFNDWMCLDAYSLRLEEDTMMEWYSEYDYFNSKRFSGGVLTFTDPELDGKKMV